MVLSNLLWDILPDWLSQAQAITHLREISNYMRVYVTCLPWHSVVKNASVNAGYKGLKPGSGRSHGGGNDNPVQYSCLRNPMERGVCQATVHGPAKSETKQMARLLGWLFLVVSNSLWPHMDCSPPSSSVHGIFQAGIPEWVAISPCRGCFWPRDWTCISWIGRWILYHLGSLWGYTIKNIKEIYATQ